VRTIRPPSSSTQWSSRGFAASFTFSIFNLRLVDPAG
jgi:hypothetical protein